MKAILTDVTKCIGCERCVSACRKANDLGQERPYPWKNEDGLSSDHWCSVVTKDGYTVRKQCRHCISPACASACPVGAFEKTPEGPVTYDGKKCMGCRYCMMACPYGIPRYAYDSVVPYVRKCQMCYETRVSKGLAPACVEACPAQATVFGDRERLLAEARTRLAENPGKYVQKIFGETEVGGTCVLYLSPIELDFLSLGNKLDDRPMPSRTVHAMEAVPPVFIGVGIIMTGLHWTIGRRIRLQRERNGLGESEQHGHTHKKDGDL